VQGVIRQYQELSSAENLARWRNSNPKFVAGSQLRVSSGVRHGHRGAQPPPTLDGDREVEGRGAVHFAPPAKVRRTSSPKQKLDRRCVRGGVPDGMEPADQTTFITLSSSGW
jgi:hypothetical protein